MKKISFLFILLICFVSFAQEEKTSSDRISAQNAIGVTIGGNFIVTGTFPSYLNERVDQFVTRIYNQAVQNKSSLAAEPEKQKALKKELESYSLRKIKLKRVSGEEINLDLLKFRRTGDYSNIPYLRHDDVLIFPPTDIERSFFTVSGAVMKPGKFHFAEGDKLSDAIELAEGINRAYENPAVKIYRSSYDGSSTEMITAGVDDRIELQRGDRIVITADEPQKKDYNIFVIGEVNSPGAIPVTRNGITIKDAVERAGGIKPGAWLENARIYTGNSAKFLLEKIYGISGEESENYDFLQTILTNEVVDIERMMMYRLSNMTMEDTGYFSIENRLRVLTEGSSFDLSGIDEGDTKAAALSYVVRDGDIIVVPVKQNSVYLFGSVVNPGHIPYEPGKKAAEYITRAGGFGENARDDEVMVIKGTTRQWIPAEDNPVVEPGDFIYIPRDEPRTFNYYVGIFAQYLGILGSAATVILLLIEFGK